MLSENFMHENINKGKKREKVKKNAAPKPKQFLDMKCTQRKANPDAMVELSHLLGHS